MAALTLAELEEIAKTRKLTKAERKRKSQIKNAETCRENLRKWRLENPDKRASQDRAARKKRLARDPDFERRAIREWREAHPGYNQDYAERNRETIRAQGRRRRAKEYGAEGSHTVYELQMLMVRQANMCANPFCRVDLRTVPAQVDHKLALVRGGSDYITNIQYLCRPCNARKHDLTMSDWLSREERRAAKMLDRMAP